MKMRKNVAEKRHDYITYFVEHASMQVWRVHRRKGKLGDNLIRASMDEYIEPSATTSHQGFSVKISSA